jgi:hypothetical protein
LSTEKINKSQLSHWHRWKANLHKKSPNHDAEKKDVLFYGRLRKIGKNL